MTYLRDEGKVIYQSKGGKKTITFDALKWLATMCRHVPNQVEAQTVLPFSFQKLHVYIVNMVFLRPLKIATYCYTW